MESHSMMLEHTLVMAGECVDEGTVWQGWPSKRQFPLHHHRSNVRKHLDLLAAKHRSRRTTADGGAGSGSGYELEDDDLVGLCSQVNFLSIHYPGVTDWKTTLLLLIYPIIYSHSHASIFFPFFACRRVAAVVLEGLTMATPRCRQHRRHCSSHHPDTAALPPPRRKLTPR